MDYIASLSYGKDSLAMLHVITDILHKPLTRIVTADVWATDTISADPPDMVEFKAFADAEIKRRWGIEVEHICATNKDGSKRTFEGRFYRKYIKGQRVGIIRGWPKRQINWCNGDLKVAALNKVKSLFKGCVQYVGIADDELERKVYHKGKGGMEMPLVEAGWTEQMCREWCEENNLLAPIYARGNRGGCWFCYNATVSELRNTRHMYPDLWALMLKWDEDAPAEHKYSIRPLSDYEKRYKAEDDGLIEPGDRFKWQHITDENIKALAERWEKLIDGVGLRGEENMEITLRPVESLTPYADNAKIHDAKQIANVANSIKRFGWQQPIVVDDNGVVVIGHCRLLAAKKLKLKEVPVTVASGLTDEEIKELRIADNKTNESPWDFDLLEKDIEGLEFEGFDFEWDGIGEEYEEKEVTEDEYDPDEDVPEEPTAKRGDIYQLGRHRLMCGDSTMIDDVNALMDGELADMFLTDPPYNVDYQGGTKDALKIMNDSMEDSAFRAFLTDAFINANLVMADGAAYYIWHADSEGLNFRLAVRNASWKLRQCLIWVKNSFVMGRQDYQWKHEPCLYGWKDGCHYFTDDRSQPTVIDENINLRKLSKAELLVMLSEMLSDKVPTTVLYEDKPLINDIHPTMKPIRLMARLIKNSSKPGQVVLDLFGGSGSTMMACEQLDRSCYTMELDPRYVDAIINRWEKFTGEKAVLLNG